VRQLGGLFGRHLLGRAVLELLEHSQMVDDVAHVEEGVALEPDVDERRLHPRQHP